MAKVIHNVVGLIALLSYTATQIDAIRVYWNTNTGPIVPPTSTPAPVPKPPFREPAPVWEDQSDDVPNPNPYVYILPPPSRPRYNDITVHQRRQNLQENIAQPTAAVPVSSSTLAPTGKIIENPQQNQLPVHNQQPVANNNQNQNQSQQSYPTPVANQPSSATQQQQYQQQSQQQQRLVPSLAARYVPNQGIKYYAVVPVHNEGQSKSAYLKTNDALLGKYERYDKPNGRYNAKLKKYKAFEKVKYVPYYMYYDVSKQQYVLPSISPKAVNNNL